MPARDADSRLASQAEPFRARFPTVSCGALIAGAMFVILTFSCPCATGAAPAPAPATTPAPASRPANLDAATWNRMLQIDARAGKIETLIADFRQQKFTSMLKKPLVSSGKVFVRGSSMLWDTQKPEPTTLAITPTEARIYYPAQKVIEVYQVREKLGSLAASPVPRLSVLNQHFSFEPIPLEQFGETDDARFFAVRMTPLDAEMREHVQDVRVLLDARRGLIMRLEMGDPDGDRTVITFLDVQINAPLKDGDLVLHPPPDVKITRPLAGLESNSPASQPPQGSSDRP
jgi:outer membrane lipoprotein-sorting protein